MKNPWITYLLMPVLFLTSLLLGTRFWLKSDMALNWIRSYLESSVENSLGAELTLEHLEGDPLRKISAKGIHFRDSSGLELSLNQVDLSWNPWSLNSERILVHKLKLSGMHVEYHGASNPSQPPDSNNLAYPWGRGILVEEIQLQEGFFGTYQKGVEGLAFSDMQILANAEISSEGFGINLKHLKFITSVPFFADSIAIAASLWGNSEDAFQADISGTQNGQTLIEGGSRWSSKTDSLGGLFDLSSVPITEFLGIPDTASISLKMAGNLDSLSIGVILDSENLHQVRVETSLQSWLKDPRLTLIRISAEEMNLPALNKSLPTLNHLKADVSVSASLSNWEELKKTGKFRISSAVFQHPELRIPILMPDLSLSWNEIGTKLNAVVSAEGRRQSIQARMGSPEQLLETPWTLTLQLNDWDPEWLTAVDDIPDSRLNGTLDLQGNHLINEGLNASGKLDLGRSTIWASAVNNAEARFSVDSLQKMEWESKLNVENGQMVAQVQVEGWDNPNFESNFELRSFNLSGLKGLERFPTELNMNLKLSGQGKQISDFYLKADARIDSSMINGRLLQSFNAEVVCEDSIMFLKSAKLRSEIADAELSGRRNLLNRYEEANYLDLDAVIKDLSTLQPLLGVENLSGKGAIQGRIKEVEGAEGGLRADLKGDFNDFAYKEWHISRIRLDGAGRSIPVPEMNFTILAQDLKNQWINIPELKSTVAFLLEDKGLRGRISGSVDALKGTSLNWDAHFLEQDKGWHLTLNELHFSDNLGEVNLRQASYLSIEGYELKIRNFDLAGDKRSFMVSYLNSGSDHLQAKASIKHWNLSSISNIAGFHTDLEGELSMDADVTHLPDTAYGELNMALHSFNYEGIMLDSVFSNLRHEGPFAAGEVNGFFAADTLLRGDFLLPVYRDRDSLMDQHVNVSIESQNLDFIKTFLDLRNVRNIEGKFDAKVALSGSISTPELGVSARLKDASFSQVAFDSLWLNAELDEDKPRIYLNLAAAHENEILGETNAELPFYFDANRLMVTQPKPGDSIHVSINSEDFNLAAFNPFAYEFDMGDLQGVLNIDLLAIGEYAQPQILGSFQVADAAASFYRSGVKLRNGIVDIAFSDSSIAVESIQVSSGNGTFTSSGNIGLKDLLPHDLNLTITENSFEVANSRDLKATISGNQHIGGTFSHPEIKGRLLIDAMEAYHAYFTKARIERIEEEPGWLGDVYDSLKADLLISIPERLPTASNKIRFRKNVMPEISMELKGELQLQKEKAGELQVFGAIETERGYVRELGKRFELSKGTFMYTGDYSNPMLEIHTVYRIPRDEVDIYFDVLGTMQRPEYRYSSSPAMETEDIVSYTLFSRPFAALGGWQQTVARSSSSTDASLRSAAADLVVDRAGAIAEEKLGLDIVEIDYNDQTAGSGTTVKAGKYLSDKIMIAVIQQLGSNATTQFTLEYQLKKNLQLLLTQSEDNRTGADILWRFEY